MEIMQPTTQLRWNRRPDTEQNRLEQLWTEVIGPHATYKSYPDLPVPKTEWRPIELVKIGWKNDEFGKPLPYVE